MKTKKYLIMLFAFFVMFPSVVQAKEVNKETFLECVNSSKNTCVLTEDVVVEKEVEITGDIILDLNGHSITPVSGFTSTAGLIIVHNGATLTVNDSVGTGEITTKDNKIYVGILMTKKGDVDTEPATLVVNGGTISGYYYGISGNGNRYNTNITINGGKVEGANSTGIYHPQVGTLVVNGGVITGETGIEMRSGSLEVNGGTIIGTYVPVKVDSNGNGPTSSGAGVAVAQHTTKNKVDVVIKGGTIEGFSALYQSNPEKNSEDDMAKVSVSIEGGTLNSINGGTVVVYSENFEEFITGGIFNKDLTKTYVKTGYEVLADKDNYIVSKIVPKTDVEELDTTKETEKVVVGIEDSKQAEKVLLDSLQSILKENEKLAELAEEESVTVAVEIADIKESELDEKVVASIKEKAGDSIVATYLDITVAVRKTLSGELLTNISELTEKVELTVLLPEDLKNTDKNVVRTYYIVKRHVAEDGTVTVEKIPTKLSKDGNSLTFETSEFSTYALAYSDTVSVEEKVDKTVENPKTFDGITSTLMLASLSLMGITGTGLYLKKQSKKSL